MAAIWGAVIGGVASIAGGLLSGDSSSKAAGKQAQATRDAAEIQARSLQQAQDKSIAQVAPFRQLGVDASAQLSNALFGPPGSIQNFIEASPSFDFQLKEGTDAINENLKARGLFGSGAGLELLEKFNLGLVASESDKFFDRLFKATTIGSNAATQNASNIVNTGTNAAAGQFNAANNAANIQFQGAQAQSAGITNAFNTAAQIPGNILQAQQFQRQQQGFGGGGVASQPSGANVPQVLNAGEAFSIF